MFEYGGEVHTGCHLGMPFGAVASVHAWHRIGEWVEAYARCTYNDTRQCLQAVC